MNKELYIITGASKGLGKGIAFAASKNNSLILLIGRNENNLNEVAVKCRLSGAEVVTIVDDISNMSFSIKMKYFFENIIKENIKKVYLFNNASVIDPINTIYNLTRSEQKSVIDINVTATIWITSEVLRFSKLINPIEIFIVNISSGVSLKPICGWSLYCISKAAINMLTACIAEETKSWDFDVFTFAVNPGALSTEMQEKIREASFEISPISEKFTRMYKEGILKDPMLIAAQILQITQNKIFENGKFIDLNMINNN
jgi:benzil reductase ((S)-benzoin forming)